MYTDICNHVQVGELQKLDTLVREQVNVAITYAERLVAQRINKQQYLEVESGVRTKREEACQKMDAILASL